jgi:putative DNA primase/helicase
MAGAMRRRSMSEEAILAALLTENSRRCLPALPEGEVRQIARSVAHYEAASGVDEALRDTTDAGNAHLVCALYGDQLRYDHRRGRWLAWRGHWWAEDTDGQPQRLALDAAQARLNLAFERLAGDDAKAAARWAIASRSRNRLEACLWIARSLPPVADAGDAWDANPWVLGVANGLVDLRTGELRPGRPEDRITMHAPVECNPDAQCPRWIKFLNEIFSGDGELMGFVRRAVGYSLTGSTREQCFFALYGSGANGKSVLLETLRHVLGPYAFDSGFSTFEDPGRYPPHPEQMAELAGRRLVTASETRESSRLNEQRLKALSHGDTTSAAFKHRKRFEFTPECKIWLGLNHKPRVADDSIGFWRSVRLIPFERQFLGTDADLELASKLKAEAPGILVWAVRACLEWQQKGLGLPDAVAEATVQYNAETDPIRAFIQDHCIEGTDCKVPTGDFYKAYLDWADREGIPKAEQLTHNGFSRRVGERYERKQIGAERLRVYLGIGLLHSGTA